MPSVKISTGFSELLPIKNVAGVIMAIPKSAELWVVGDGSEKANLERLAKELGKSVIFFGRVNNQQAREIMKKSDVFILNSFHEGMPHALIEALVEGVPVIATKIPAVLEILEDKKTGLLVKLDDVNDLSEKLRLIPQYRDVLVKNGRRLYEAKFTWEKHLVQLYNVFNGLVNNSRFS